MDLDERLSWLAIGCLVGYCLGYLRSIIITLKDIKEELDEVDDIVKHRDRDERGTMKRPSWQNIALFVVVLLTVFASFQSQVASNRSDQAADRANNISEKVIQLQREEKQNVDCLTQVLFDAINALNERTTYSSAQIDANIQLIQGQLDWLSKAQNPNLSQDEQLLLFQEYVTQVQQFIELSNQTKAHQNQFPYPTAEDLKACLTEDPEESN